MRVAKTFILFAVVLILASCAAMSNFQANWDKRSDDQKARVICAGFQKQLDNALDQGTAYVALHPELHDAWMTRAIPAFRAANKLIGDATDKAKAGSITPQGVYDMVQKTMDNLLQLAVTYGVKKGGVYNGRN